MGAFENITDKIVLLLQKTRDVLLSDLEKEFSSVRNAVAKLESQTGGLPSSASDALSSAQDVFNSCTQVVKAVFAQVGVDISHCEKTEEFANLLTKPLALLDTLATDIEGMTGEGEPDYAAIAESALKTVKDLIQLVKDFQHVEMDKIGPELEKALGDAYKQFDLEDFALSLLEYILITVLRSGREVFADEIKYVKLQANSIYSDVSKAVSAAHDQVDAFKKEVQDGVETFLKQVESEAGQVRSLAKSLFRESVDDLQDVYTSVAKDIREEIDNALKSQTVQEVKEAYEKVSGILSKTCAVLDFFGIIGEKTVEIKLPDQFIDALSTAAGEVQGVLSKATETMSGYVSDITESANGTVTTAIETVNALTGAARGQIDGVAKSIDAVIGEDAIQRLDLTADLVDIPAVSIPDFSAQIQSVGPMLSKGISGVVDKLNGLSYPITITTFKWGKIEKMFTAPADYFKEQYPVDSVEDVEAIVAKVLDIARLFNPDIPDFSSVRNLLESLLKELGELVLTATAEARAELWKQVKPLMTMIRKTLDLLQEMYESLKREAHHIVQEIKRTFLEEVVNPVCDMAKDAEHAAREATDEAKKFAKKLDKEFSKLVSKETMNELVETIVAPAIVEAIEKSKAPNQDPEKVYNGIKDVAVENFTAWGSGVYEQLKNFFDEDAWEKRLDGTIAALQATLAGDVSAVRNFLSPSTLKDLPSIGDKASALKDSLDINQYIKIVSEAFDDVSIPRPDLYYQGFKQALEAVLDKVDGTLGKYEGEHVTAFVSDVAAGVWERVKNRLIQPFIRDIKKEIRGIVRRVIRKVIDLIFEQLPSYIDLKPLADAADAAREAGKKVRLYAGEAQERIGEVKNLTEAIYKRDVKAVANSPVVERVSNALDDYIDIDIDKEWLDAAVQIAKASVEFSVSDMSYKEVVALVVGLYKAIPDSAKKWVGDILPSLPKNDTVDAFCDFVEGMDYKADLENSFAILTLLDVKSDEKEEKAKDGTLFNASALLQVVVFEGTVPSEKKDDKTGDQTKEKTEDKTKEKTGDKEEEEEKDPALYCMIVVSGKVALTFNIGSNHTMSITTEGGVGGGKAEKVDEDTAKKLQQGVGFYVTKGWEFNGVCNWDALHAMFVMDFQRKQPKEGKNALQVFDTQYLSFEMGNYPQVFYLGYDKALPGKLKDYGYQPEESKKDSGEKQKEASSEKPKEKTPEGNHFQVGYYGAVQDGSLKLHLQDVAIIKEIVKDDIELKFDTYLLYDYQKGFDFGGDVSLHLDYDLNHKKIGPLVIDSFSLDAGKPKGEKGKLQLVVGTTFQAEFSDAMVIAVENLGVGFTVNYLDADGKFGDFDVDASFSFPSGFGITIDASVAKGGGFISYDKETCEFFGMFTLDILEKVGVTAYLLCDPGTAAGHFFSLVVLLGATFNPGIPLGMGFSLTAVGGTLGLNRALDRDAISNGVRTGTLAQVFFVTDPGAHLAEMKSTVVSYFPPQKNQFFLGFLGQISFEPIVSCSFGLLLQLPKPVEIIIVGALRVSLKDVEAAEKIFKINVYFAGGINFETGMWFDASLVDSHLVGLTLSGDMAFRLNWGGQKGFLLSIGGFHPAYKPEAGLSVGQLRRTSIKLDYKILKISLESYLAVTSNTFQIGARLDVKIGWDRFGLIGYAGFDALFQFDPFMFLFNACAGVDVQLGSWKVLTASVNLDVSGPAPWRVAGKAKFKALGIPVKVSFSYSWGKKTPQLPSKQVAILPLLQKEWENDHNWTIYNNTVRGAAQVTLFGHETAEMVLYPDGSITFNQSALPMLTKDSLEKMDICNDAVPTDYDILTFSEVNGLKPGAFKNEENDFAPVLYKNLTIKEKLSSESYVKYVSGFTMDERENCRCLGRTQEIRRNIQYEMCPLSGQEVSAAPAAVKRTAVKQSSVLDMRRPGSGRKPVKEFEEKHPVVGVANNRRDRASFDRYIAELDSRSGLKKDSSKR